MRIFASWDALAYSALVGSMRCRQRSVEIWWWLREREKHALWSHQSDKEAALILSPLKTIEILHQHDASKVRNCGRQDWISSLAGPSTFDDFISPFASSQAVQLSFPNIAPASYQIAGILMLVDFIVITPFAARQRLPQWKMHWVCHMPMKWVLLVQPVMDRCVVGGFPVDGLENSRVEEVWKKTFRPPTHPRLLISKKKYPWKCYTPWN